MVDKKRKYPYGGTVNWCPAKLTDDEFNARYHVKNKNYRAGRYGENLMDFPRDFHKRLTRFPVNWDDVHRIKENSW